MKEDKEVYVFDTSALLTYIEDEEGSENIENLLIRAEKGEVIIYVAFVSLTEVFYITMREKDESEAMDRVNLIQSLAVKIGELWNSTCRRVIPMRAGHFMKNARRDILRQGLKKSKRRFNG